MAKTKITFVETVERSYVVDDAWLEDHGLPTSGDARYQEMAEDEEQLVFEAFDGEDAPEEDEYAVTERSVEIEKL